MRSNLLSLQNISRQVSSTQNKLATGNKVNSAIDNPSSYYTARSLSSRADDLNALLDSMGQAVSTIKAATTALDAAASFLQQATAVANQALENGGVPAGAVVVSTEADLRTALANADNKEIIISGEISLNSKIELAAGQKLTGIQAYDSSHSGRLIFNFAAGVTDAGAIMMSDGSEISDLAIDYTNQSTAIVIDNTSDTYKAGIISYQGDKSVNLKNLDITGHSAGDLAAGVYVGSGTVYLDGKLNLDLKSNNSAIGFVGNEDKIDFDELTGPSIIQNADSTVTIKASSDNPSSGTSGGFGGLILDMAGTTNIESSIGVFLSVLSLSGTFNLTALEDSFALVYVLGELSSTARLNTNLSDNGVFSGWDAKISAGAELMGTDGIYRADVDTIQADPNSGDYTRIGDYDPSRLHPQAIAATAANPTVAEADARQYQNILNQYDQLIKDASYKGINLLQSDELGVKFNESGSAALLVKGRNMSSAALGLQIMDWQTQGDIAQSLKEISAALKSIRSYSAELGNNYSIITSRQDFTENLVNILTEGADKLTLADMNEESANMLALQTRQQLAINSLSLASQASQAVLKLF